MKISQMLIDFASEFIAMADTLEQKQSHLNAACSAWNIAIMPIHVAPNYFSWSAPCPPTQHM